MMSYQSSAGWDQSDILALVRSPFLVASVLFHTLLFLLAVRAATLTIVRAEKDSLISVQLLEGGDGGSSNKSIGPGAGSGGPRTMPKLGTNTARAERSGKKDTGSFETSVPNEKPPEVAAPPKPPALPEPKVLAANTRSESFTAPETSPDSLVRLPKETPIQSSGSAATDLRANQRSSTELDSAAAEPAEIGALKEGTQIPGALKGTGTATGSYGVPGGRASGTGLAGAGSGVGMGGGSLTGLRGSSADYNQYLTQLKKRVESVWKFPQGVSGVQKVSILFTLDRAGRLVQSEILESTDARMNTSALEAMRRASPFAPIPETLKDLANTPLRMQFTVTVDLRG